MLWAAVASPFRFNVALQHAGRLRPVRDRGCGARNRPTGSIAEPPGNFHLSAFRAHSADGKLCFNQSHYFCSRFARPGPSVPARSGPHHKVRARGLRSALHSTPEGGGAAVRSPLARCPASEYISCFQRITAIEADRPGDEAAEPAIWRRPAGPRQICWREPAVAGL